MEGIGNGEFDLPGFRFHPTEEELVGFYLKKKLEGQQFSFDIIGTLDLYKHDPWELPGLAYIHGEREWFFFVPRDTKSTAPRRSRLTASGYWKATGSDKPVRNKTFHCIGLRKTLVFYRGKAPTGEKTDWVMKEYRMPDFCKAIEMQKEVVLCHIHRKATSKKTLEQRSMAERGEGEGDGYLNIVSDPSNSLNWSHHYYKLMNNESESCVNKCDDGEEMLECRRTLKESKMNLAELQVPSLYVESLFSPWTDIINSWTPSILFCPPKEEYHCNNI